MRSSKYLNNVVEQDHRRIKQRIRPMLGFKRFETAAITISGIELAEKIRKHQFMTGNLPGKPATAPDIWAAILAAWPPSTSFRSPDHVHWQSLHQNRNGEVVKSLGTIWAHLRQEKSYPL
jgi:hypothetical protein